MENQDLIPEEEREFEPELAKRVKQHKIAGIIVAVVMIVLGLLIAFMPTGSVTAVDYTLSTGVLLMGVYELIVFFRTAAPYRNDMTLASGVIMTVLGLVVFALSFGDLSSQATMLGLFTLALGFLSMYRGILQFFAYARFKKIDEKDNGWLFTSGLLNLILGVLMVVLPFAALLATTIILGIYLTVAGIALLAEAISGKVARRK
ncbi:MAG: DUF308 domain-containing protein [Christensenella sp.]|nr:DUF308 domain-containing protein [Christensenella sp.]